MWGQVYTETAPCLRCRPSYAYDFRMQALGSKGRKARGPSTGPQFMGHTTHRSLNFASLSTSPLNSINGFTTNRRTTTYIQAVTMSGVVGNATRKVITSARPFPKQTVRAPNPDDVASALRKLLPKELPASLDTSRPGNLYQVLSRHPDGGVGRRVTQCRWGPKGIEGSYWIVTRAKFKLEGKHGKAWGKMFWKGACSLRLL